MVCLWGRSVSRLARKHDVNANQIFAWRKAYQEGCFIEAAFVPVVVTEADSLGATYMRAIIGNYAQSHN